MSDVPPVGTQLGELVLDEVFIHYDGPKLFTCFDKEDRFFLGVFVDEYDDGEIYLYASVSSPQLDQLRSGQIKLRSLFEKPLNNELWVIRRSLVAPESTAELIAPSSVDPEWLPSPEARLEFSARSQIAGPTERLTDEPPVSGETWRYSKGRIVAKIPPYTNVDQATQRVSVELLFDSVSLFGGEKSLSVAELRPEARSLLTNLAHAWPFIEWEEVAPWGALPETYDDLVSSLQQAVATADEASHARLEMEGQEFLARHDIARILGSPENQLLAIRRGALFSLISQSAVFEIADHDLLEVMDQIGDRLARIVSSDSSEGSVVALNAWLHRRSLRPIRIAEISTGMSASSLRSIEAKVRKKNLWSGSGDPAQNELYAAARMCAGLSPEDTAHVIDLVSEAPLKSRDALDIASKAVLETVDTSRFTFEVGYELATWYRDYRSLSPAATVDPIEHLVGFNVDILSTEMNELIDAISVWGPNHGPCVIVNDNGKFAHTETGRRTTLAHELGHLIFDRRESMPLVEVLGGRVREANEVRARAFAAELLLPREVAGTIYLHSPDHPASVVAELTARYGVSREVAAWQIRNSGVSITPRSRTILRRYVRRKAGF